MIIEDKTPHNFPAIVLTSQPPVDGVQFVALGFINSGMTVALYAFNELAMDSVDQARKVTSDLGRRQVEGKLVIVPSS
jgi:hypothetical protein